MMTPRFSMAARCRSVGYALNGLRDLVTNEHNARIHLLATVVVLAAASYFSLAALEWAVLLLAMAAVWTAEAFNTALEHLADACIAEPHPLIGRAKDAAAAAVLLSALFSVGVAVAIFWPYLIH